MFLIGGMTDGVEAGKNGVQVKQKVGICLVNMLMTSGISWRPDVRVFQIHEAVAMLG